MTASRHHLYGETSHMHCSGVILAHSSTQSSNLGWLAFHVFLHLPFFMCSILFHVSFHFITHNLISEFRIFLLFVCYRLLGLLPTAGENFMSTAPLEIYLLRKTLTCSILILPAVYLALFYNIYSFGGNISPAPQRPPVQQA